MGVSVVMILIVLFMAKEAKRYQMAKAEANAQHIPEAKMVSTRGWPSTTLHAPHRIAWCTHTAWRTRTASHRLHG